MNPNTSPKPFVSIHAPRVEGDQSQDMELGQVNAAEELIAVRHLIRFLEAQLTIAKDRLRQLKSV